MDTIIDQTSYMIDTMVGLGIVICIASVYVAVNMLVSENRRNISMLKVLGYPDRKIGCIVLGSNHVFLPLGIFLSIPAAYAFCGLFFRMFADMMGMLTSPYLEVKSCIMAAVLTAGSYLASMYFVQRKTRKADAVECLKEQRE